MPWVLLNLPVVSPLHVVNGVRTPMTVTADRLVTSQPAPASVIGTVVVKMFRKCRLVVVLLAVFAIFLYMSPDTESVTSDSKWPYEGRNLISNDLSSTDDLMEFPEVGFTTEQSHIESDWETASQSGGSSFDSAAGRRYFLPVFRFGGGPNNQYRSFKIAVRFALHFNRTLVLGPFFNHPLINKWESRNFSQTFDIEKLGQLVKVAPLEDFYADCHGVIEKIVHGKPFIHKPKDFEYYVEKYKRTRRRFAQATGIKFPGLGSIPHSTLGSAQRFQNATVSDCLAFYCPYTIDYEFMNLTSPVSTEEFYKTGKLIDEHVVRAPYVRKVASVFEQVICKGTPYAVLHWRVNDDFMQMWCDALKSSECKLFRQLNETGEFIAMQIRKTMEEANLHCVYIARPPGSWDLVSHLEKATVNVFTANDVLSQVGRGSGALYEDNYILSLVEQELAARSELFIGSSGSSWTCFVRRERQLTPEKKSVFISETLGFPATTCV
ncbi:uncharacterized protein [Ptychodera flava]|uniref:uncharacterized protein n=1 Tax=Ptychodera flava TaxID=63121 RepID=UPI00396A0717